MPTIHLLIKGKVQGVFYRASASGKAKQLGLTGWIKNTSEGHVEATVSGEDGEVQAFIEWCKKGPPLAAVDEVVSTLVADSLFDKFEVLR